MSNSSGWVIAHTRRYHGLGNRVRVVLGARVLAREEGRRFAYVWHTGKEFGARFDELWEVNEPTVPTAVSRALATRYHFRSHDARSWVNAATRRERLWQIRTAHALVMPDGMPDWTDDLRELTPAPDVAAAVGDFHGSHLGGRPYVGVMVRTHPVSHVETLDASPIDWYVERLRAIRREHGHVGFFVSADTPEGLERLQREVPGCVGQTNKGSYNSRSALRAAVVDLYLLAASVHLVGPHYSSFVELAQHLGGPRLRLETALTSADAALENGPLTLAPDPRRPHVRLPTAL